MRWRLDDAGRLESESGYLITKAHIERGHIERRLEPVYRAFTPTGGFLGACGVGDDAKELCVRHRDRR